MVQKQQGSRRARHDNECSKVAKSKNNNKTTMLKEKNKNQQ
jgi:hypothetical protein